MPVGHASARTRYCGTPSGPTRPGTRGVFRTYLPRAWAGDGWLLNRGAQPSRASIGPPIRRGRGRAGGGAGPRAVGGRRGSGAGDDVDGALLRALAAHRGVRVGLPVVTGPVGAGVAARVGVLVG